MNINGLPIGSILNASEEQFREMGDEECWLCNHKVCGQAIYQIENVTTQKGVLRGRVPLAGRGFGGRAEPFPQHL